MGRIADAVLTGSRRAALEAMSVKLADDMDAAPPAVVAQIAGRLSAVLLELEGLPSVKEVSKFDEIANRRSSRRAVADNRVETTG